MMAKRDRKKLRKEIRFFGRIKPLLALPLFVIGILGLILPIIPGTVFLVLGLVLIVPSLEDKIRGWFSKNVETN